MDVIAFAVVLVGLAAFVAAPLYRSTPTPAEGSPSDARREAASRALDDLEVDRASGLVDDASYTRERAALDADTD